jgi:hypothetical protein
VAKNCRKKLKEQLNRGIFASNIRKERERGGRDKAGSYVKQTVRALSIAAMLI